jgi:hypothetical protein
MAGLIWLGNRMVTVRSGADLPPRDLFDDLHGFASGLLGEPAVGDALRLTAVHGLDLAGAERAAVLIPDGTSGTATVSVAAGAEARDLLGVRAPLGEWAKTAAVLSTGSPPLVDSTPLASDRWLFVPLVLNRQMLALLAVGRSPEAEPFDEGDAAQLQVLAADMLDALKHELGGAPVPREDSANHEQHFVVPNLGDSLIARIHAAGLHLHTARLIEADPAATALIDAALVELDQALHEIRTTMFPLGQRR